MEVMRQNVVGDVASVGASKEAGLCSAKDDNDIEQCSNTDGHPVVNGSCCEPITVNTGDIKLDTNPGDSKTDETRNEECDEVDESNVEATTTASTVSISESASADSVVEVSNGQTGSADDKSSDEANAEITSDDVIEVEDKSANETEIEVVDEEAVKQSLKVKDAERTQRPKLTVTDVIPPSKTKVVDSPCATTSKPLAIFSAPPKKSTPTSHISSILANHMMSKLSRNFENASRHSTTSNVSPKVNEPKFSMKDVSRPMAGLLGDLGLELVRQYVYRDLVEIQTMKNEQQKLEEKDKVQLEKLNEAHKKLVEKNRSYFRPLKFCRCRFATEFDNVMELHVENGNQREEGVQRCCLCEFQTKMSGHYIVHMLNAHGRAGRAQKKCHMYTCPFCSYENNNKHRIVAHISRCERNFSLNSNLLPQMGDSDIPLIWRVGNIPFNVKMDGTVSQSQILGSDSNIKNQLSQQATGGLQQNNVVEIGGQLYSLVNHRGKALLTSLRSQVPSSTQMSAGHSRVNSATKPISQTSAVPGAQNTSATSTSSRGSVVHPEACEICSRIVGDRERLWMHFRTVHKVELNKASFQCKEPWVSCEMCPRKFWTYQGLARHAQLYHKKNSLSSNRPFSCPICRSVLMTNPLNHMSSRHNITLLDMFREKECSMCYRRLKSGKSFEQHMVNQHSDIFANQDVLRTVLQALNTALLLKQYDAKSTPKKSSSASSSVPNKVKEGTDNKKVLSILESVAKKQSGNIDKKDTTAVSKPSASATTVKTPESPKLSPLKPEDIPDIGRPFLRSMRSRLSSSEAAPVIPISVSKMEKKRKSSSGPELDADSEKSVDDGSPSESNPAKKSRLDNDGDIERPLDVVDVEDHQVATKTAQENSTA